MAKSNKPTTSNKKQPAEVVSKTLKKESVASAVNEEPSASKKPGKPNLQPSAFVINPGLAAKPVESKSSPKASSAKKAARTQTAKSVKPRKRTLKPSTERPETTPVLGVPAVPAHLLIEEKNEAAEQNQNKEVDKVTSKPRGKQAPANSARKSVSKPIKKKQKNSRFIKTVRKVAGAAVLLAIIAGAGMALYGKGNTDASAETKQLVSEVGKKVILPKGEAPSVSTVVDENKIDQQFLQGAKEGDKVLLYFQAARAIVYRPSTGQIVNVGPIETPKPRVFIRNGATADNAAAVEGKMKQTSDYIVVSKDEAANKNYKQTVVVDVTGTRPDVATRLAQYLGAKVSSLPISESRPDADVLVIAGSDYAQKY